MSKNHQDRLLALAGVYLIEKLKMIKKDQEDHKNIELKTDINLIQFLMNEPDDFL